jgi:ribosomal protein S18 acetylase RimI-like enzyme
MAAFSDFPVLPKIVELSELTPADLDPLLAEEIDVWRERFSWDFRPSADLLRRFLQIRALYGCALRLGAEIVGYSYFVYEGRKGLIGDFYLRRRYANTSLEMYLLGAVVEALMRTSGIRRIESQLMLVRATSDVAATSFHSKVVRHDRYFMEIGQSTVRGLTPPSLGLQVRFIPWAERYMEEMAHLLVASYRGHVDSEINDQYRNLPGARQFLNNIVRFPGCGCFAPEASLLAFDTGSGRLCGMCLASHVSEGAGHLTQVCVLPALRGMRLGYELIRRTSMNLVEAKKTAVSLTVTRTNVDAVRLYRSLGFREKATFPALVWDKF